MSGGVPIPMGPGDRRQAAGPAVLNWVVGVWTGMLAVCAGILAVGVGILVFGFVVWCLGVRIATV